jgi:hypothetical protein
MREEENFEVPHGLPTFGRLVAKCWQWRFIHAQSCRRQKERVVESMSKGYIIICCSVQNKKQKQILTVRMLQADSAMRRKISEIHTTEAREYYVVRPDILIVWCSSI